MCVRQSCITARFATSPPCLQGLQQVIFRGIELEPNAREGRVTVKQLFNINTGRYLDPDFVAEYYSALKEATNWCWVCGGVAATLSSLARRGDRRNTGIGISEITELKPDRAGQEFVLIEL